MLFPTNYATNRRSGQTEAESPLIYPEKDWWWNGASMKDFEERADGSVEVTVSSYVGGGETEDLTFNALRVWMRCRFTYRRMTRPWRPPSKNRSKTLIERPAFAFELANAFETAPRIYLN